MLSYEWRKVNLHSNQISSHMYRVHPCVRNIKQHTGSYSVAFYLNETSDRDLGQNNSRYSIKNITKIE